MMVHVGFENYADLSKVVAISTPASSPVKRMIQQGKVNKTLIDLTSGRRTRGVLVTDEGTVILIGISPETVAKRSRDAFADE